MPRNVLSYAVMFSFYPFKSFNFLIFPFMLKTEFEDLVHTPCPMRIYLTANYLLYQSRTDMESH